MDTNVSQPALVPFDPSTMKLDAVQDNHGLVPFDPKTMQMDSPELNGPSAADIAAHGQLPPEEGAGENVAKDWMQRGKNMSDISTQYSVGNKSLGRATLDEMAQMGAGIGDVFGEGIKAGYNELPQVGQEAIQGAGKIAANSIPGRIAQNGKAIYEAKVDPDTKAVVSDLGNIAMGIPAINGAESVIGGAASLGKDAIKSIGNVAEDLRAPPDYEPPNHYSNLMGSPPPWTADEQPWSGEGMIRPRTPKQLAENSNYLDDDASRKYKMAESFGAEFTPKGGTLFSSSVRANVEDATGGMDPQNHGGTLQALKTLDNKADEGLTLTGMDNVRKTLGRIANNTNPDKANDAFAARQAIKAMDNNLAASRGNASILTGSPEALDALEEARKSHSLGVQYDQIRNIIRKANRSGDEIQNGFKDIADEEDFNKGKSSILPANQDIIASVADPGLFQNVLKGAGKFGIGKEGDWRAWAGEGAAGAFFLNPAIPAVAGTVGTASNITRNFMIRKAADQALKNIEAAHEPIDPFYGQPRMSPLGQKALPAPAGYPALPNPEYTGQYNQIDANGNVRPPTADEDILNRLSQTEQAKRAALSKVPQNYPRPELQQVQGAIQNHAIWQNNVENYIKSGRSYKEAIDQYGKEPELPPQPNVPGVEQNQVITRNKNLAERDAYEAKHGTLAANRIYGPRLETPPETRGTAMLEQASQGLSNLEKEVTTTTHPAYAPKPTPTHPNFIPAKPPIPGTYARGGAVNTNPSEHQKIAGNYKKGHMKIHGLDITIENPKGSARRGKDKGGKEWEAKLPADYGYIKKTVGLDGDHVDCFIGPNHKSNRVYIIHQRQLDTKKLDEHKCFIGFNDKDEAVKTYKSAFSDGKGKDRIMRVERMSVPEFKTWLKEPSNVRK